MCWFVMHAFTPMCFLCKQYMDKLPVCLYYAFSLKLLCVAGTLVRPLMYFVGCGSGVWHCVLYNFAPWVFAVAVLLLVPRCAVRFCTRGLCVATLVVHTPGSHQWQLCPSACCADRRACFLLVCVLWRASLVVVFGVARLRLCAVPIGS